MVENLAYRKISWGQDFYCLILGSKNPRLQVKPLAHDLIFEADIKNFKAVSARWHFHFGELAYFLAK
jgi:hypothetical protein